MPRLCTCGVLSTTPTSILVSSCLLPRYFCRLQSPCGTVHIPTSQQRLQLPAMPSTTPSDGDSDGLNSHQRAKRMLRRR